MNTIEQLDELQKKAAHNPELKQRFLASKDTDDPLGAFCQICQQEGYDIYPMDIIQAGDEFYATMKRSTNGGGENSPVLACEDDAYELFFAGLESMEDL